MNQEEYKKLTTKNAVGRKVVALLDLAPGLHLGDELTIIEKKNGLSLAGRVCPTCSVTPVITKVSPLLVELIPEEEK